MIDFRMRAAAVLVAFTAGIALAAGAGITGYLGGFDAAVGVRRTELAALPGSAKSVAALDKARSLVASPAAAATYAGEVKAAAKAANLLAKKLPAETGLSDLLTLAGDTYDSEIRSARTAFAERLATLTGPAAKKAKKALAKADKALVKAAAAATTGARLKSLAAAAKLLGVQPDDGIPDGTLGATNAAADASGHFLYAAMQGPVGGLFDGHIRQFRIESDGTLTNLVPPVVAAGVNVTYVAAHPTLPVVYATSRTDRLLHVFSVGGDGTLSPMTPPTVDLAANDAANVGFSTVPLMVVPAQEGDLLFVLETFNGGSPVVTFALNSDGTVGAYKDWEAGTPFTYTLCVPRRNPVTKELRVYTTSPYENGLFHTEIRSYDVALNGTLTWLGIANVLTTALAVAPGGDYVYAPEIYDPGTGTTTGVLSLPKTNSYPYLDAYTTPPLVLAGATPTSIVLNEAASRMYLSSVDGLAIRQFDVNGATVAPKSPASVTAPPVVSMTMSRDGKFLFALRSDAHGLAPAGIVATFLVNATTGALTAK